MKTAKTYDWKITARKAAAWATATFLAGVVGSIQGGELKSRAALTAGALALAVGGIQGLRNYLKNQP